MSSPPTPPEDAGLGIFSESAGEPGDPGSNKRKRRWPKRLLIGLLALVVVVVGGGVLYAFTINHSFTHNVHRAGNMPPDTPSASSDKPRPKKDKSDKSLDFVLMGSDSRDASDMKHNARSDTLMVVHLDGDRHAAHIISFPRDMYVDIPGRGKNKINAAYSFGGPQLAVRTLEQLTNVRMDHFFQVDFTGFIKLTKNLGGVTVTNDHAFSSGSYHYPKGKVTLKGKKALKFVRERHKLPHGDLDRSKNQRKVVQALLSKGLSKDTIKNPSKFNTFVSGVATQITADHQLSNGKIRKTALSLRMGSSDIEQIQAPISGFKKVKGAGAVDIVDKPKMSKLSKAWKADDLASYLKKHPD